MVVITVILTACTPEQISDAIEDCQNNPECIGVVDSAITEELAARGITGGLMTQIEIETVQSVLRDYYINPTDFSDELYHVVSLYFSAAQVNNPVNQEEIQQHQNDLNELFKRDDFVNSLFLLEDINTNLEQYLTYDNNRYILYKTGVTTYRYEVQAEQIYEFDIDTELNKVYLSNQIVSVNTTLVEELIDNQITYENTYFFVDNNMIYYAFSYDGYLIGAFNLDTQDRHEILMYDFGYDIVTYQNNNEYARYSNVTFTGTISDFLTFIKESNESINSEQLEVINTLLIHNFDIPTNYTVNIIN